MADPHPSAARDAGAWRLIPAGLAALGAIWFAGFLPGVVRGEIPELVLPWVPALGIEAAFRLDGLALAFALLICGIGALCFVYAASYFRGDRRLGALLVTLCAFAVSMLGIVTADDAVTLFVFWEATTITSWLLVGFDHERPAARAAALQALLVTGLGGLALLAGLLLMGDVAGGYRLSAMNAAGDLFRGHDLYPAMLALVLLGCFAKSAQFPFQFWLPGAMAAPTPVSAYLHSATMVKAGIYLMARLTPSLGGTDPWFWTLASAGGLTMLLGAVWAIRQTDMKLLLAHTTVMALGLLTLLLGIGAIAAAMTFLLVHAFYKAALFLAVGMIERGAGARDYPAVGGLAGAMPRTAAAAWLAALSMAGFPPMFGFIGKEMIYTATSGAATVAALAANALMVACAGVVALRPFLGTPRNPRERPGDPAIGLWLGPVVLAALGLVFGFLPGAIGGALVGPMTRAVTGGPMPEPLALWHGLTPALWLSLLTFALGGLLYARLDRLRDLLAVAEPRLPRTEGWYDAALSGTLRAAAALTGVVLSGRMTRYLRVTFLLLAALIWGALLTGGTVPRPAAGATSLVDWAVVALIAASVGVVLRTPSRLAAICALGGVGAGIAIIFVLYGAIDVAMTQLFAEVLVVVFLAIAMARLPRMAPPRLRPGNAAIAILLGLGVTFSVLAVLSRPLDPFLSRFFEEQSVPAALGHNIVNVILVDFRGFDTLGEISVIVIAGVAAIAALRAGRDAAGPAR